MGRGGVEMVKWGQVWRGEEGEEQCNRARWA